MILYRQCVGSDEGYSSLRPTGFVLLKSFSDIDLRKRLHTADILYISERVGRHSWHLFEHRNLTWSYLGYHLFLITSPPTATITPETQSVSYSDCLHISCKQSCTQHTKQIHFSSENKYKVPNEDWRHYPVLIVNKEELINHYTTRKCQRLTKLIWTKSFSVP